MEKRSERSRFYLAEVPEADEISYNGHGVVDGRRNFVGGLHAEIEGVYRRTIGADGEKTLSEKVNVYGDLANFVWPRRKPGCLDEIDTKMLLRRAWWGRW